MENTTPFLFDNVDEKFFLAMRGKAVGPLTAQDVYQRILKGDVGLLHYFWRDGWGDWKRVCDEREFAVLIPQKPAMASIDHIKKKMGKKAEQATAASSDDVKNYYLYFSNSQYGPFSKLELIHVLKSHKLNRSAYLWMPGWPNWKRLTEIAEFAPHVAPPAPADATAGPGAEEPSVRIFKKTRASRAKGKKSKDATASANASGTKTMAASVAEHAGTDASEKRGAPRRPLVARLFLHNDKDVIIAVCRDISVGGMQVLTDRVPGPVGTMIKLNVSPGDPNKVKSFVAEGEIVRVLEDGRGFSFRFKKITDEARKTIERYIKEP